MTAPLGLGRLTRLLALPLHLATVPRSTLLLVSGLCALRPHFLKTVALKLPAVTRTGPLRTFRLLTSPDPRPFRKPMTCPYI